MKDLNSLWQGRLRDFAKTMSRYSRLILNDHMALILLVAFGFFSIYYQQLLTSLQSQPPQGFAAMGSALAPNLRAGQELSLRPWLSMAYCLEMGRLVRCSGSQPSLGCLDLVVGATD